MILSGVTETATTCDVVLDERSLRLQRVGSRDVAFDPISGDLFIAGGIGSAARTCSGSMPGSWRIRRMTASGGDGLSDHFPTAVWLVGLEGLGTEPARTHCWWWTRAPTNRSTIHQRRLSLRRNQHRVAQLAWGLHVPSDVTVAPARMTPGETRMYIVDRETTTATGPTALAPMDGRLYEMMCSLQRSRAVRGRRHRPDRDPRGGVQRSTGSWWMMASRHRAPSRRPVEGERPGT